MNWLRNFMVGRYGGDQLSIALLILSVLLNLVASFSGLQVLAYIGYVPLFLCFYRMFSKDKNRRSMENYKFNMLISPVYSWFRKQQAHTVQTKTHKFFKCPKCKAKLRLPKGKGKVVITCPKCKVEFTAKT